jgi:MYND finger
MGEITLPDGTVICKCKMHQLEACHKCGFDSSEMNETARAAQAAIKYCQNAACGAAKATLRCTGCDNAWYDSRECQKARWRAGHKAECNDMAEDVLLPGGLGCEPVKQFKKGTRLVMRDRSGHVPPRDLYATVIQFVPGKGPYADASVKYNSRRYNVGMARTRCAIML